MPNRYRSSFPSRPVEPFRFPADPEPARRATREVARRIARRFALAVKHASLTTRPSYR